MRLNNKVAIVTGASRGMGAETALLLAREGADVVQAARSMSEPAADKTRPGTISNCGAEHPCRAAGRCASVGAGQPQLYRGVGLGMDVTDDRCCGVFGRWLKSVPVGSRSELEIIGTYADYARIAGGTPCFIR